MSNFGRHIIPGSRRPLRYYATATTRMPVSGSSLFASDSKHRESGRTSLLANWDSSPFLQHTPTTPGRRFRFAGETTVCRLSGTPFYAVAGERPGKNHTKQNETKRC
jgi:hypothetical protein